MPHLESKTKLIMTASVNWYINPIKKLREPSSALLVYISIPYNI